MEYPTLEEIEANIDMENAAIELAVEEMAVIIEATPLTDGLKIYAILALAAKYATHDYIDEVFNEIHFGGLIFPPGVH